MIKISEGELLDLLPSQLKNDTDMQCLSYALKVAFEEVLEYERGTMTQNFVDSLPEEILDVLAVELRGPYYLQSMDIEVKRGIIKKALIWHTKAGTASAVSEMIATIFGVGQCVEWFEFTEGDKTPGYFDIVTSARMTEDIVDYFIQVIERVKNERSHIRRILIERAMEMHEYVASGVTSKPQEKVLNHEKLANSLKRKDRAASGVIASPKEAVTNNAAERIRSPAGTSHAAAGMQSHPHDSIGNNTAPASRSLSGTPRAAVATISSPKVAIFNGNQSVGASIAGEPLQAVGAVSSPHIKI